MSDCDVAIVGAGAAGLATAIFTARAAGGARIVVFEGARAPGAKILVSGGGRCNVTNVRVDASDFNGSRPPLIRRVLQALPVDETITFFRALGVTLHEEVDGKLFPDSERARDVVGALLGETARLGVQLRSGCRVLDLTREADGFLLQTSAGPTRAAAVVMASGGLSLPKTGSDGWGYDIARRLGHTIVPTTPALVPLVVNDEANIAFCRQLSGVSLPVRLDLRVDGAVTRAIRGSLLWTHFGVSGPAALDVSRHWLRARLNGAADVRVTAALCPDDRFESLEDEWMARARQHPRGRVLTAVGDRMPGSIAAALLDALEVPPETTLATLTRDARRSLTHALLAWPLAIHDSRGYNYAEVTAGGVSLNEVDVGTMRSRVCQGLYLVGEILDVDGRLGGFNFQWAWASAHVAGTALGATHSRTS